MSTETPDTASCRAIPEVRARDAASAISEGHPFVVRRHPLVQRLAAATSFSDLARRLAGKRIDVEHKHRWIADPKQIDAGEYLSNIAETEYYWRHFPLRAFGLDAPLPKPARPGSLYFDHGWIGPTGTVQTFHHDNEDEIFVNHNLFAQVVGRKYAAVASPADSAFFQSLPLTPGDSRHSRASPWDDDTRSACTSLAETMLEAGDLLYIPPRYWHFMKSCSASMSISRWWFDSRIAELIYAAAVGVETRRRQAAEEHRWANDLAEIGGADVLNELVKKKPTLVQLRFVLELVRVYGKGILNDQW